MSAGDGIMQCHVIRMPLGNSAGVKVTALHICDATSSEGNTGLWQECEGLPCAMPGHTQCISSVPMASRSMNANYHGHVVFLNSKRQCTW